MKKHLLPAGFQDILPPQAWLETKAVNRLLINFSKYGYEQVKPPLLEFADNLSTSSEMTKQTFRFVDPISQETVAIRPDMTGQIARIVSYRLDDKPLPVRICYSGQVLRVNSSGAYPERQLVQSGLELIGSTSPYSDAEVVLIAAESLKKLRIKKLNIDFNLPSLLSRKLEKSGLNEKKRQALITAINKKDFAEIENQAGPKLSKELLELMNAAGDSKTTLTELKKILKSGVDKQQFDNLSEVISIISKEDKELNLTIDPLEQRGFDYHSGLTFSIFTPKTSYELGRGGRYEITRRSGKTEATGVTLYVNSILRSLPKFKSKLRVLLPINTTSAAAKKLRDDGYVTVMALEKSISDKTAKNLDCDFILANGKLRKISQNIS